MKPNSGVGEGLAARSLSHWNYHPQALQGVTVLAVTPDDAEHRALRGLFDHTKWVLDRANSLKDAWARIEESPCPVILISQHLPDGEWTDLLERLPTTPDAPRVIVTTSSLDSGLYELVLRRGAFDVILKPFKAAQLYPVVSDAWWQWKSCCSRLAASESVAATA